MRWNMAESGEGSRSGGWRQNGWTFVYVKWGSPVRMETGGTDRAVIRAKNGGKPSGAKGGREMDARWTETRKAEANLRK